MSLKPEARDPGNQLSGGERDWLQLLLGKADDSQPSTSVQDEMICVKFKPLTFSSSSSVASGNFSWSVFFRTFAMYLMP